MYVCVCALVIINSTISKFKKVRPHKKCLFFLGHKAIMFTFIIT